MKKKLYLNILLVFLFGNIYPQQTVNYKTESGSSGQLTLNETQLQAFSQSALRKAEDLGNYISTISNKSVHDNALKTETINLAVDLFIDENQLVQVSSVRTGEIISEKTIRAYLNKLRIIPADRVDIKWYNIHYVSNFKKGPDGKYYGVITVFQKFTSYTDGRIGYTDVTQKNMNVRIDTEETIRGTRFVAKLGNISVVETKLK